MRTGWKYSGEILEITDSLVVINDFKIGKIKINLFDIASIYLKNGRQY